MLNGLLRSHHGENPTLGTILAAHGRLAPNVPEVTITTPRPLRSPRILHIEPAIEWHPVRDNLGSINGALALIAHGRGHRLPSEQHRMNVGIARGDDTVGDKDNDEGHQPGRVDVPLLHQIGQPGIDAVEEAHGWPRCRANWLRLNRAS